MYTHLAEGVGKSGTSGAFRSLERGYIQWSSGRLTSLEVNLCHPLYCHVRGKMIPSMRQGHYDVYLLLRNDGGLASAILSAKCDCAAG